MATLSQVWLLLARQVNSTLCRSFTIVASRKFVVKKGKQQNMQRPFTLWLLVFFLLFLALGGLYGGIAMLADPTGSALQMTEILSLLPVPDYTLPGLFLLFVMGLVPLFLTYALLVRLNYIHRPTFDYVA